MTDPTDLTDPNGATVTHAEFLTTQHIKAATTLFDELAVDHEIRFALVSGSQAFGLGHGTSDVDLYAMAVGDKPLESRFYVREGLPVQVNVVTQDKLDRALEWGADDGEFTTANRAMLDVQDDVRKLAIRLSRGHLVYATDEGRAILGQFNRAVMRRRVIARQSRDCAIHLEDITGGLAAGDRSTAFWAARIALVHACEAALAGCDDIYVGRKFLLRRLSRAPELKDVLRPIHRALDVPDGGEPELVSLEGSAQPDFERVIRQRARLAAYLSGYTALVGWDELLTGLPAMVHGDRGPVRDPYFTILRFGDGIGLAGPDKAYRVSPDAARLWLSLDGTRTAEEFGDGPEDARVRGVAQLLKIGAAVA